MARTNVRRSFRRKRNRFVNIKGVHPTFSTEDKNDIEDVLKETNLVKLTVQLIQNKNDQVNAQARVILLADGFDDHPKEIQDVLEPQIQEGRKIWRAKREVGREIQARIDELSKR